MEGPSSMQGVPRLRAVSGTDGEFRFRGVSPGQYSLSATADTMDRFQQQAVDLMAEELRCGRPVPLDWRVQIADEFGVVVNTSKFASLLFGDHRRPERQPGNRMLDAMLMERAKATFARVRRSHSAIDSRRSGRPAAAP